MLGGMVFEMAAVVSKVGMVRVSVEMDMKEGVRKVLETFEEDRDRGRDGVGGSGEERGRKRGVQRDEQEGPGEKETRKILRKLEKAERKKRERDEQDREGDQDIGDVEDVREVFEIVEVAEDRDSEQGMEVNEECGDGSGDGDYDEGVEGGRGFGSGVGSGDGDAREERRGGFYGG